MEGHSDETKVIAVVRVVHPVEHDVMMWIPIG